MNQKAHGKDTMILFLLGRSPAKFEFKDQIQTQNLQKIKDFKTWTKMEYL